MGDRHFVKRPGTSAAASGEPLSLIGKSIRCCPLAEVPASPMAVETSATRRSDWGGWSAKEAMGELNQKLLEFLFTLAFWLQKIILELAIPFLLIGAIVLLFSRRWGWRFIWGTALAVVIALLAKPVVQALPGIVSSISFP